MESTQTMDSLPPEDDEFGQATVRELIVKLALIEDEHRNTTNPGQIEDLARREQAIVAALHLNELSLNEPGNSNSPGPSIDARPAEGKVAG